MLARVGSRAFATSQHRREPIRSLRNAKYLLLAHRQTKDAIWPLLDALRRPTLMLALSDALHAGAVSVSEYNHWSPALRESTIDQVSLADAPPWVLLYFIAHKVRSSLHAHGPMLDLVYARLDSSPNEIHGPLLLCAAVQLARFGLVVPLRGLAKTFLSVWIQDPAAYFNLMLQVVSCIPNHTVESANIAVLLLKAMESRHLTLTSDTYQMLLDDRFVTLQLTKYLQSRMVQEGFVPPLSHLEAYLRFFAKDGAIHDAKKYYNAIHSLSPEPDDATFFLEPSSIPQVRANTLMLGTYNSAISAFGFLRKLAALQPQPTIVIPSSIKRSIRTLHRILHRTKFRSVYDFTSILTVLTRDTRCTAPHLLKLFTKVPGGRPTVAVYTALIRGLLLKGDTVNAVAYWKKLLKSGIPIDSEALAVGVAAITRAGRPYDAFLLLEQFGSHNHHHFTSSTNTFPSPPPLPPPHGRFKKVALRKPVTVTQETINDFMVSLNRIDRPDIVFRLWDYMEPLYGVQPNAFSLSILLQAARLAHRLDDTLVGAIAHLSLKNPFRRSGSVLLSREDAVSGITSLLYDSNHDRPRSYGSGIWHDSDPLTAVGRVFVQVVFGIAAERRRCDGSCRVGGEGGGGGEGGLEEMVKLESPASAARMSVDDDPAAGLGFGFSKLRGVKYVFEPFEDLVSVLPPSSSSLRPPTTTTRRSHYPSIFPTNANCLQYILLLTLARRSHEIPLLLAWMRFLGIQPSGSTLALSLAVWSEVSCQAPLIEGIRRRVTPPTSGDDNSSDDSMGDVGQGKSESLGGYENGGREYVRLVRWMVGWVGERRIPGVKDVGKWMRNVRNVREVKR